MLTVSTVPEIVERIFSGLSSSSGLVRGASHDNEERMVKRIEYI
jgi:hypothetical protein